MFNKIVNANNPANFYRMFGMYDHCEEVIITGLHANFIKMKRIFKTFFVTY